MAIISTCRDTLLSSFCKMVQLGNTHILSHSNKQNTRSNRRKFSRNYFTCSQCDLNHALNGRNMTSTQVKLSISAFLLYVVGLIGFSNTQLPHSLYPRSRGQSFFLFNTRCFWSLSSSERDWAKLSHCVLNPIYPAYIRQQLSEPDWTKLFRYILNPIHTSHNRATSPHDP